MEKAKKTVHILPIGFESDKLITSIRQYPVHSIILIMVEGDDKRSLVQEATAKVKEAFKGLEIEERIVAREDIFQATLDILDIIEEQAKKGNDIKINIAGGMRNLGISSYIASLVSKVNLYTDIPESDNEKGYVLKGIMEIPIFPIKEISQEQMEILYQLDEETDSLDTLISRLKPELDKGTTQFDNERSRLSHHIKKLKNAGFVETEKRDKMLSISRSVLGEIYTKGTAISKFKKEKKD
jgi:CRISPR-associated protein Csa3